MCLCVFRITPTKLSPLSSTAGKTAARWCTPTYICPSASFSSCFSDSTLLQNLPFLQLWVCGFCFSSPSVGDYFLSFTFQQEQGCVNLVSINRLIIALAVLALLHMLSKCIKDDEGELLSWGSSDQWSWRRILRVYDIMRYPSLSRNWGLYETPVSILTYDQPF